MKLRLTAPGFETYSGQMGVIVFENGLSTSDVLPIDAVRVAGVIGAEWENGTAANVSQLYLDSMHVEAPVFTPEAVVVQESVAVVVQEEAPVVPAAPTGKTYSEEELAQIADKKGVTGLREIADSVGVKGTSIRVLIDGILKSPIGRK